jgi:hypothetical protein
MAITTLDGLIAANNQLLSFNKVSMTSKAAGYFQSLWTAAGLPTAGAAAGSVAGNAPSSSTIGALGFVNPTGGALTYLTKVSNAMQTAGTLILYDRLVHTSALSGILATAQTVNSAALTRSTSGEDVQLFLEWYTATGATAVTVTCSYTNSDGVAGRTSIATTVAASPVAGMMLPLPLQAGDKGVRSVQTVTLSATTGGAGNFGITLAKRIAEMPILIASGGLVLDPFALGMPKIENGACLALMELVSTATTGLITGTINLAQG